MNERAPDPTSALSSLPAAAWRELAGLAGAEGRERPYLEHLLRLWCRRWGAPHAGLYLGSGDGAPLEAAAAVVPDGRPPYSSRWAGPTDGALHVAWPHGILAYRPGDAGEVPADELSSDPVTLLLSSGLANRGLKARLKEHRFQANFRGVELEALYDVGLAVASTLDLDALSEEILLRAVSLLDARRGVLYLRQLDGDGEDGAALGADGYALRGTFGGAAPDRFEGDPTAVPADLLPGAEHLLALPVEIDGDPRGLLVVADKESRTGVGPFPERDLRTLALFANQAAIALENARLHRQALEKERLEREMELAADIQRQILPKGSPAVEGFEVHGWSRPARQVGGDYYDLLRLADGRLRLTLGDVSGKGVPAALLVSTLHSALRLLLADATLTPELLERINRHVAESSAANKFITLVAAELDPATGVLRYINCGHNPGFLVRAGGGVEKLESSGLPLGLLPQARYELGEATLGPGDLVCVYSDGMTEAEDPAGEEYGEERLLELLTDHRFEAGVGGLAGLAATADREVAGFTRGAPQGDDQTVVLLRRLP